MSLLQREAEILKVGFPLDSFDAVRVLVVLVKDGVRQGVAEEKVAVGAQAAERLIATNERVATKVVFDQHVLAERFLHRVAASAPKHLTRHVV